MNIKRKLSGISKRLRGYVHHYGFIDGICTLARAVCGRGLVSLRLPGCQRKILVRRHTTDVAAFEQVFVDREYDLSLGDMSPRFIIDAGANVGCASVFFAQRYPNASIYAIEPEHSNYEVLARNAKHYKNITPIEAALWNEDTFVEIANPHDEKWSFRVKNSSRKSSASVRAVTVASLMGEAGVDRVDILKLDIEGAEIELLDAKCGEWIDRVDVIIIELHDWIRPGCRASLLRATEGWQYDQFRKGENTVLIRSDRR